MADRQVITQLVVDASGAQKGVADYEAALARARQAANDAGTANNSFDSTLRKWTQSLARTDPVLRAQVAQQKALERQTELNTRAVQLGIATQEAANSQLERVRLKYQGYIDNAVDAERASTGFGKAMTYVFDAAAPLLGILSAASLIQFARSAFENAAALEDQAQQAGVSVEAFQAYRAVLVSSGVSADQAGQLIGKLTQTIGQSIAQAGGARDAFNQLGLSARDVQGGVEAALPRIAAALLQIPDATERARLEADLFGRTGQQLESALQALIEPTADLIAKETALKQVLGHDVSEAADDASKRLGKAFHALQLTVTPVITALVSQVADLVDGLNQLATGTAGIAPVVAQAFPGYAAAVAAKKKQDEDAAKTKTAAEANGSAFFGFSVDNKDLINTNTGLPVGASATNGWSTENVDKYLAAAQQAADMAGLSATRRAQELATIGLANAQIADANSKARDQNGELKKQVSSYEEARQLVGEQAAKQVEALAAITAQGQQWRKVRETFDGYLDQLDQAVHMAGEGVAQRQAEAAVIQGAQILQRQHNVEAKDLVRTYGDAVQVLGSARTAQIEWRVAAADTNNFQKQTADQIVLANAALAAGRYGRDLAVQIAQRQLELGSALMDSEKERLQYLQQINDTARLDDYTSQLRDEVSLAGLSADERERQEAVLEAMRATHGHLTDAQQQEIQGLIAARQETERWRGVVDGITGGFQDFFNGILTKGTASFGNLWRAIEAQFAQLLAWMASQALVQPIIIPMVQAVMGTTGAMGGAAGVGGLAGSLSSLGGLGGLGSLGGLGGLGSLGGLLGIGSTGAGGLFGGGVGTLGASLAGGFNALGGALGFATPSMIPSAAGLSGALGGVSTSSIPASLGAQTGSIFGSTTLGGLLGGFGLGSVIGGMMGGNSLLSGGLGAVGMLVGGPIGMLAGGLLGGALGDFGAGNQSSTAAFNAGGGYALTKQGSQGTAKLASQAGDEISAVLQALSGAGVDYSNPLFGVNIGNDKSYLYYTSGQKQKLSQGGDVETAVSAALDVILRTVHTSDANMQEVLDHYLSGGGINAQNVQQVVSDLGFAKTLANFDFGTTKLTQTDQLLKNITDQFDQAMAKAKELGLDTAQLQAAEQDAIQSVTDDFNDAVSTSIDSLINGPIQQWNALIRQQQAQMDEAKSASADLDQVERLQYLQRKQLLMQMNDADRQQLMGLIDLTDELAAKTVNLQAQALGAINTQAATLQTFIQNQNQLSGQYTQAGTGLTNARLGFLVDTSLNRFSPADAYSQARQQLQDLLAQAQGGSLDALTGLPTLAQTFLNNSLAVNATSRPYGQDFDWVQSILSQAAGIAGDQSQRALDQAALGQKQLDALGAITTELQKPDPNTDLLATMVGQLSALSQGVDVLNLSGVIDPINSLIQLTAATAAPPVTVITNVADPVAAAAQQQPAPAASASTTVTNGQYSDAYLSYVQMMADNNDADPAIRDSNYWVQLARKLGIPGYAGGTGFAPGGLALVGEYGPEFVNLPRGSQVFPASAPFAGGMADLAQVTQGGFAALLREFAALKGQVAGLTGELAALKGAVNDNTDSNAAGFDQVNKNLGQMTRTIYGTSGLRA
jgi:hypothetical protein